MGQLLRNRLFSKVEYFIFNCAHSHFPDLEIFDSVIHGPQEENQFASCVMSFRKRQKARQTIVGTPEMAICSLHRYLASTTDMIISHATVILQCRNPYNLSTSLSLATFLHPNRWQVPMQTNRLSLNIVDAKFGEWFQTLIYVRVLCHPHAQQQSFLPVACSVSLADIAEMSEALRRNTNLEEDYRILVSTRASQYILDTVNTSLVHKP